ncbi:HEAT repeat domain-containing protein [Candidatus Desantisbacteria bacterium]|nr:HEAT repeat domain-containing protein [Candidatus Desantisbacteria bacterium]
MNYLYLLNGLEHNMPLLNYLRINYYYTKMPQMKKILLIIFNIFILFFLQSGIFSFDEQAVNSEIEILKIKTEDQFGEKVVVHFKKWDAKKNLVNIGKDAVLPLINTLDNENARYYVIRALGEIGDERAVESLSVILLDTTCGSRRFAAIALGKIKSKKAIPALKKALNDNDDVIKKDARVALDQINAER